MISLDKSPWRYLASFDSFPLIEERAWHERYGTSFCLQADKIHLFVLEKEFSFITSGSMVSESFIKEEEKVRSIQKLWDRAAPTLSFFDFFRLCIVDEEKKALKEDLKAFLQSKNPEEEVPGSSWVQEFYRKKIDRVSFDVSRNFSRDLEKKFSCRIYIRSGRCFVALAGPTLLDRCWKNFFVTKEALIGYLNVEVEALSSKQYLQHFLHCYTITSLQDDKMVTDYAKRVFPLLYQLTQNPFYRKDLQLFREEVVTCIQAIDIYQEKSWCKETTDFLAKALVKEVEKTLAKFDFSSMKHQTRKLMMNSIIDQAIKQFPDILNRDSVFSNLVEANNK